MTRWNAQLNLSSTGEAVLPSSSFLLATKRCLAVPFVVILRVINVSFVRIVLHISLTITPERVEQGSFLTGQIEVA